MTLKQVKIYVAFMFLVGALVFGWVLASSFME